MTLQITHTHAPTDTHTQKRQLLYFYLMLFRGEQITAAWEENDAASKCVNTNAYSCRHVSKAELLRFTYAHMRTQHT